MKKNDIFEHEAEGIKLRFQLVELKPYLLLSTNGQLDDVYKGETASISLDKVPTVIDGDVNLIPARVIEKAMIWVTVNYNLLMDYWNYKIDSLGLLKGIKKI